MSEFVPIPLEIPQRLEVNNTPERWSQRDFNGFLHLHSWEGSSCGRDTVRQIVQAITNKTGLEFIGFSEHVGWPGEEYWPEKILREFEAIDVVNAEQSRVKVFKGIEANVLKDGSIDAPQELLDQSDIVVASHHYLNIEPQEESTAEATVERWVSVMDRYHDVNILGHPLRDLPEAEWPKVDWDRLCAAAKEKNVAIEVGIANSAPQNLPDEFLEALVRHENLVSIAPDFHKLRDFLSHREEDLAPNQKAILDERSRLMHEVTRKTFREGDVLKCRKVGERPLSEEEVRARLAQRVHDSAQLGAIEDSGELQSIYDILSLTEKEEHHFINPTGEPQSHLLEKYPLPIRMLMTYARRIDRVRKAGVKRENLINLWSKEQLSECIEVRKQSVGA